MINSNIKVLMAGPARTMKGGIASIVNQYFEAGLEKYCKVNYIPTIRSDNFIGKIYDLLRAIRTFNHELQNYNIVHLHVSVHGSFKRKRILASMVKKANKKLIIQEHSGEFAKYFNEGDDKYRNQVREFFGWADRVLVLSESWRDYFGQYICDSKKISVLHNGVDVSSTCPNIGLHQDVLFLGKYNEVKCPDLILHAATSVLINHPKVRFRFAGDGNIKAYYLLANELGIADSCEFMSWVNDEEKEKLFSESGIFCLPSKFEGMPMSMLEAMAHGLVAICTPVGGIPEVINDGCNGYIISSKDEDILINRLNILLDNNNLMCDIGYKGWNTIYKYYNINNIVKELINIYSNIME